MQLPRNYGGLPPHRCSLVTILSERRRGRSSEAVAAQASKCGTCGTTTLSTVRVSFPTVGECPCEVRSGHSVQSVSGGAIAAGSATLEARKHLSSAVNATARITCPTAYHWH
jgi:hypothetical protein